jgi:S-formylglutathione hydrolase FrmB
VKRSLLSRLLGITGLGYRSHRLELALVDSRLLGRRPGFSILRPPPDADANDRNLPLVYLLHGLGDNCRALDKHGVSDLLLAAMEQGRMPRANVVMPSGERGFYVDWYDGSRPYESHIIEEVLPAAEQILGAPAVSRERRHIAGVSMGGIGALQIGLRHPDRFASIASLSGPVLDERQAVEHLQKSLTRWLVNFKRVFGDGSDREFLETHNPWSIVRRRAPDLGQRLYIAAGAAEKPFFLETTLAFHSFLEKKGVSHAFELSPGRHGWRFWTPVIARALGYTIGRGSWADPRPTEKSA